MMTISVVNIIFKKNEIVVIPTTNNGSLKMYVKQLRTAMIKAMYMINFYLPPNILLSMTLYTKTLANNSEIIINKIISNPLLFS